MRPPSSGITITLIYSFSRNTTFHSFGVGSSATNSAGVKLGRRFILTGEHTNDCVIAQNDGTGSFAKKGAGTLVLRAENTWGGDTILAGGVLKSGIDSAIPADGTFVLAGGTLDMNGTTLSDGTSMPKKWAVDVPTALTNGTIVYNGNLAFPEGSTMELRGSEALAGINSSLTLLTVTGTVTGAPSLPSIGDPRWKVWWHGNSIRLTRIRGTSVVIR